jgi:hypothetical protein
MRIPQSFDWSLILSLSGSPGAPRDPTAYGRGALPQREDRFADPVDRFDRQPNVIGEKLGHILCYHPTGSGRAVLPYQRRLDR